MIRRPPGSTRTDTLFPYTTLFRSGGQAAAVAYGKLGRAVEDRGSPSVDHRGTELHPGHAVLGRVERRGVACCAVVHIQRRSNPVHAAGLEDRKSTRLNSSH